MTRTLLKIKSYQGGGLLQQERFQMLIYGCGVLVVPCWLDAVQNIRIFVFNLADAMTDSNFLNTKHRDILGTMVQILKLDGTVELIFHEISEFSTSKFSKELGERKKNGYN
jgi:hypothetical protein